MKTGSLFCLQHQWSALWVWDRCPFGPSAKSARRRSWKLEHRGRANSELIWWSTTQCGREFACPWMWLTIISTYLAKWVKGGGCIEPRRSRRSLNLFGPWAWQWTRWLCGWTTAGVSLQTSASGTSSEPLDTTGSWPSSTRQRQWPRSLHVDMVRTAFKAMGRVQAVSNWPSTKLQSCSLSCLVPLHQHVPRCSKIVHWANDLWYPWSLEKNWACYRRFVFSFYVRGDAGSRTTTFTSLPIFKQHSVQKQVACLPGAPGRRRWFKMPHCRGNRTKVVLATESVWQGGCRWTEKGKRWNEMCKVAVWELCRTLSHCSENARRMWRHRWPLQIATGMWYRRVLRCWEIFRRHQGTASPSRTSDQHFEPATKTLQQVKSRHRVKDLECVAGHSRPFILTRNHKHGKFKI